MSEVGQHQLLITLVHGTWAHWFLIRRPLWFEDNSPFLTRLSAEFGDIPHKIEPLRWSGANSIYVRDKTAQVLAKHLLAEHAEHPQDAQLIIAHSHGGNIALRALHHLQKHNASRSDDSDGANPLVVTLATPFIEIHQADFGGRPSAARGAVLLAMLYLLGWLAVVVFPSAHSDIPMSAPTELSFSASLIFLVVVLLPLILVGWYWIEKRANARQTQVEALSRAPRLGEGLAPQRLLVIRAIDDEASLILALGVILNYLTTRSIMIIYWIITTLAVSVPLLWLIVFFVTQNRQATTPRAGIATSRRHFALPLSLRCSVRSQYRDQYMVKNLLRVPWSVKSTLSPRRMLLTFHR